MNVCGLGFHMRYCANLALLLICHGWHGQGRDTLPALSLNKEKWPLFTGHSAQKNGPCISPRQHICADPGGCGASERPQRTQELNTLASFITGWASQDSDEEVTVLVATQEIWRWEIQLPLPLMSRSKALSGPNPTFTPLYMVCLSSWKGLFWRCKPAEYPRHRATTGYPQRVPWGYSLDSVAGARGLKTEQGLTAMNICK